MSIFKWASLALVVISVVAVAVTFKPKVNTSADVYCFLDSDPPITNRICPFEGLVQFQVNPNGADTPCSWAAHPYQNIVSPPACIKYPSSTRYSAVVE